MNKGKRLTKRRRKALYGRGVSQGPSPLDRMPKTALKVKPTWGKIKNPASVRMYS